MPATIPIRPVNRAFEALRQRVLGDEPVAPEEVDRALDAANREGLLRYTLTDIADNLVRVACLAEELSGARGGR